MGYQNFNFAFPLNPGPNHLPLRIGTAILGLNQTIKTGMLFWEEPWQKTKHPGI
jgi:hypothetical protein